MNDKTETKETNGTDGRITVDRCALATLVGLAKVAAALGTEDAPKYVDDVMVKLGAFATIVQAAYGIDDDEAVMHAAASAKIFEMAEKSAEGGAK